MTNAQALKAYRTLVIELEAIAIQIRQAERCGRPQGASHQYYDTLRGTNDPQTAAMQLLDGLEALQARKQADLDALRPQVDRILQGIADYKMLVIIQRYYLFGDTDEAISQLLHVGDRYICRIRNAFLRAQAQPLHI